MAELKDKVQLPVQASPDDPDAVYNSVKMRRPIPGQSLTQDPEKPLPYERPPEFTNYDKAQEYLFDRLMATGEQVTEMLSHGVPVDLIVKMVLSTGFQQGKWNPDLMLLLVEPAYYIVLFIAEVAGIDYVFSGDEEDLIDADMNIKSENVMRSHMKKVGIQVQQEVQEEGVQEAAKEALPPSLLARVPKEMTGTEQVQEFEEGGVVQTPSTFENNKRFLRNDITGEYLTRLPPEEETKFQAWVKQKGIPFDPSPQADYDMRGFYSGLMRGDKRAGTGMNPNDGKLHFSDYWKTPYHKSFSAESKFADPEKAPRWNDKDQLVLPDGTVVYDERAANRK